MFNKNLLLSLLSKKGLVGGIASLAAVSCFAMSGQGDLNAQTTLTQVLGQNYAWIDVDYIGNQNNKGYIESSVVEEDEISDEWMLPIGSTFCVQELTGNGILDFFKVVGSGHFNIIDLNGTIFHTWFTGDYPNLVYQGYKQVGGGQATIDACKNGW